MAKVDVKVPDIGDFKDVPVIEVLVKPGDVVKAEQSLISLESDKATMDVPSPVEGAVAEIWRRSATKCRWERSSRASNPRRARRRPTPLPPRRPLARRL